MKLSSINFDKGASFAPLSSLKCGPTGVGSWDIISSILGWGFDSANNVYTNDTNQSIARDTNQANQEINSQQLAWAREQYEMEKAENRYLVDQAYERDIEQRENERKYNSPAMQKQRLLAAGINPTLAMYGSGGSASAGASSAVRSQVGQNAHANQPNAIPMQTGAPMIPFSGFGQGISDAIKNYYLAKENERQDYSLAADITFRDREYNQKALDYLLDLKKHGLNEKWVNENINHLIRIDALEDKKFEKQAQWQNFQWELQNYQAKQRDTELQLQTMMNDSGISLNRAQASNLMQLIKESIQRVDSMKNADNMSEKQYWHMVGEDLFHRKVELTQLGINVEKQPFEKFGLLFGAVAQTVGLGLGAYMGLRGGAKYIGNSSSKLPGSNPFSGFKSGSYFSPYSGY